MQVTYANSSKRDRAHRKLTETHRDTEQTQGATETEGEGGREGERGRGGRGISLLVWLVVWGLGFFGAAGPNREAFLCDQLMWGVRRLRFYCEVEGVTVAGGFKEL